VYTVLVTCSRSSCWLGLQYSYRNRIVTDRKNGYTLPVLYTNFRLQMIAFRTQTCFFLHIIEDGWPLCVTIITGVDRPQRSLADYGPIYRTCTTRDLSHSTPCKTRRKANRFASSNRPPSNTTIIHQSTQNATDILSPHSPTCNSNIL